MDLIGARLAWFLQTIGAEFQLMNASNVVGSHVCGDNAASVN
jgi:hypothetical protein